MNNTDELLAGYMQYCEERRINNIKKKKTITVDKFWQDCMATCHGCEHYTNYECYRKRRIGCKFYKMNDGYLEKCKAELAELRKYGKIKEC